MTMTMTTMATSMASQSTPESFAIDPRWSQHVQHLSPFVAPYRSASPQGGSQVWAHQLSDAANCSEISTLTGRPSLPWAQGDAGSNPAAPTNKIRVLIAPDAATPRTVGTPWEQPDRGAAGSTPHCRTGKDAATHFCRSVCTCLTICHTCSFVISSFTVGTFGFARPFHIL